MKRYMMFFLLGFLLLAGCVTRPDDNNNNNNNEDDIINEEENNDDDIIDDDNQDDNIDDNKNDNPIYDEYPFKETDNYVVYINLDGFAKYYYDIAAERGGVKTLQSVISEGVMFDNLYNLTPSITNPNQAMIISGTSSANTHNVNRYFDKINNIVIQQGRENDAETIYDKSVELGINVASVRHFPAEGVLSITNLSKLYVTEPTGKVSDASMRFDQAIKLVKGESFQSGSKTYTLDNVPRLLTIYCDDLDALGHNENDHYGYTKAKTESDRINNVIDSLNKIDSKIGELIAAYKARGIYDKTIFFITTDHGMTPFGADSISLSLINKYSSTKWPDLSDKLKSIDSSFVFEYLGKNESPLASTTVVGVSTGLQMQLTFTKKSLTENQLQNIKQELMKEYYIDNVLTRTELIKMGYWRGANVDLLITPSERYHFHGRTNTNNIYAVRGQHDSTLDSSRHIYGIIWGYRTQKLGVYPTETIVTSFGVAMAETLGFTLQNANASRLDIFTKEN